jgi:hypothetical protein
VDVKAGDDVVMRPFVKTLQFAISFLLFDRWIERIGCVWGDLALSTVQRLDLRGQRVRSLDCNLVHLTPKLEVRNLDTFTGML